MTPPTATTAPRKIDAQTFIREAREAKESAEAELEASKEDIRNAVIDYARETVVLVETEELEKLQKMIEEGREVPEVFRTDKILRKEVLALCQKQFEALKADVEKGTMEQVFDTANGYAETVGGGIATGLEKVGVKDATKWDNKTKRIIGYAVTAGAIAVGAWIVGSFLSGRKAAREERARGSSWWKWLLAGGIVAGLSVLGVKGYQMYKEYKKFANLAENSIEELKEKKKALEDGKAELEARAEQLRKEGRDVAAKALEEKLAKQYEDRIASLEEELRKRGEEEEEEEEGGEKPDEEMDKVREAREAFYEFGAPKLMRFYGDFADPEYDKTIPEGLEIDIWQKPDREEFTRVLKILDQENMSVVLDSIQQGLNRQGAESLSSVVSRGESYADPRKQNRRLGVCLFVLKIFNSHEQGMRRLYNILKDSKRGEEEGFPGSFEEMKAGEALQLVISSSTTRLGNYVGQSPEMAKACLRGDAPTAMRAFLRKAFEKSDEEAAEIADKELALMLSVIPDEEVRKEVDIDNLKDALSRMLDVNEPWEEVKMKFEKGKEIKDIDNEPIKFNDAELELFKNIFSVLDNHAFNIDDPVMLKACDMDKEILGPFVNQKSNVSMKNAMQLFYLYQKGESLSIEGEGSFLSVLPMKLKILHILSDTDAEAFGYASTELAYKGTKKGLALFMEWLFVEDVDIPPEAQKLFRMLKREAEYYLKQLVEGGKGTVKSTGGKLAWGLWLSTWIVPTYVAGRIGQHVLKFTRGTLPWWNIKYGARNHDNARRIITRFGLLAKGAKVTKATEGAAKLIGDVCANANTQKGTLSFRDAGAVKMAKEATAKIRKIQQLDHIADGSRTPAWLRGKYGIEVTDKMRKTARAALESGDITKAMNAWDDMLKEAQVVEKAGKGAAAAEKGTTAATKLATQADDYGKVAKVFAEAMPDEPLKLAAAADKYDDLVRMATKMNADDAMKFALRLEDAMDALSPLNKADELLKAANILDDAGHSLAARRLVAAGVKSMEGAKFGKAAEVAAKVGKFARLKKLLGKLSKVAAPIDLILTAYMALNYLAYERPRLLEEWEAATDQGVKDRIWWEMRTREASLGLYTVAGVLMFTPAFPVGIAMALSTLTGEIVAGQIYEGTEYMQLTEKDISRYPSGTILHHISRSDDLGSVNFGTDWAMWLIEDKSEKDEGLYREATKEARQRGYRAYFREAAVSNLRRITEEELPQFELVSLGIETVDEEGNVVKDEAMLERVLLNLTKHQYALFAIAAEKYIGRSTVGKYVIVIDPRILREAEAYATLICNEWRRSYSAREMVDGEVVWPEERTLANKFFFSDDEESDKNWGEVRTEVEMKLAFDRKMNLKDIVSWQDEKPEQFERLIAYALSDLLKHELALREKDIIDLSRVWFATRRPWLSIRSEEFVQATVRHIYAERIRSVFKDIVENVRSGKRYTEEEFSDELDKIRAALKDDNLTKLALDAIEEDPENQSPNARLAWGGMREQDEPWTVTLSPNGMMTYMHRRPYQKRNIEGTNTGEPDDVVDIETVANQVREDNLVVTEGKQVHLSGVMGYYYSIRTADQHIIAKLITTNTISLPSGRYVFWRPGEDPKQSGEWLYKEKPSFNVYVFERKDFQGKDVPFDSFYSGVQGLLSDLKKVPYPWGPIIWNAPRKQDRDQLLVYKKCLDNNTAYDPDGSMRRAIDAFANCNAEGEWDPNKKVKAAYESVIKSLERHLADMSKRQYEIEPFDRESVPLEELSLESDKWFCNTPVPSLYIEGIENPFAMGADREQQQWNTPHGVLQCKKMVGYYAWTMKAQEPTEFYAYWKDGKGTEQPGFRTMLSKPHETERIVPESSDTLFVPFENVIIEIELNDGTIIHGNNFLGDFRKTMEELMGDTLQYIEIVGKAHKKDYKYEERVRGEYRETVKDRDGRKVKIKNRDKIRRITFSAPTETHLEGDKISFYMKRETPEVPGVSPEEVERRNEVVRNLNKRMEELQERIPESEKDNNGMQMLVSHRYVLDTKGNMQSRVMNAAAFREHAKVSGGAVEDDGSITLNNMRYKLLPAQGKLAERYRFSQYDNFEDSAKYAKLLADKVEQMIVGIESIVMGDDLELSPREKAIKRLGLKKIPENKLKEIGKENTPESEYFYNPHKPKGEKKIFRVSPNGRVSSGAVEYLYDFADEETSIDEEWWDESIFSTKADKIRLRFELTNGTVREFEISKDQPLEEFASDFNSLQFNLACYKDVWNYSFGLEVLVPIEKFTIENLTTGKKETLHRRERSSQSGQLSEAA